MSKTRWLISILLILVVASVIVFSVLYYRSYRSVQPLVISVSDFPAYVTSPTVILRGEVSDEARIELSRDTLSLGTVYSQNNKFESEVELQPGQNQIRLSARRAFESDSSPAETSALITWEPRNPPAPTIHPLPATTNMPSVTIKGAAYPHARLELLISADAEGVQNVYYPNAEKDGSFLATVRLPAPGTYKVICWARNSQNVKSEASSEMQVAYDPDWYPAASLVGSTKPRRIFRNADIVLTHKRMSMTLSVTLPRDDPAVNTFLANQSSLDDFFSNIFGISINGAYYIEFQNVVPEIVITDQNATIRTTTLPHRAVRDHLPVLRGELVLKGRGNFPFSNPDDRLSIVTKDYTVQSVDPPPTQVEENKLIWTGSGSPLLRGSSDVMSFERSGAIKLQLAYNPFASPRNFLRLAQVTPYNLWQYPGNAIPHLFVGLCSLIPMLWVLWLVEDSPLKNTIDSALRKDLYRLSKTLITLSLINPVFFISRGLAYLTENFIYKIIGEKFDFPPPAEAIVDLAIILFAVLLQLLALRASHRSWLIWLARISRGIRNAAFICLVLEFRLLLYLNPFLTRIPNIVIIAITLGYLFLRTGKVLRHARPTTQHKHRLILLMLVILTLFVVPSAVPASIQETHWNISQLFSMLELLLPYALAIGLLVVLKRIDTLDQRRTRHLVLTVGLILFSGFLVGTTSNLFMIPIPFIISIWMYRHFLINDFRKCTDLDYVNNEVVSERRRLIDGVLSYETAQHFQANAEKLKDKVTSGDMSLKEFEDRKSEIEKYAYDKGLASTHVNGLHAKTTVLSVGPHAEDWKNGRWCLKWGAVLIAPFLAVYLLLLLLQPTSFSDSVFGFAFGLNQLLTFVAEWLLAAFFFGYYFRYIRGNSGLEKGLRTACSIIICFLPTWLTGLSSKTDLIGVFFRAGQTFLFFTLLGMAAFDYATFRKALRDQFRWRTFARFGNMPSFTAVVSVLITSIGVGLTSVLTGQFTGLLTNLLNAVFQQAPGPRP